MLSDIFNSIQVKGEYPEKTWENKENDIDNFYEFSFCMMSYLLDQHSMEVKNGKVRIESFKRNGEEVVHFCSREGCELCAAIKLRTVPEMGRHGEVSKSEEDSYYQICQNKADLFRELPWERYKSIVGKRNEKCFETINCNSGLWPLWPTIGDTSYINLALVHHNRYVSRVPKEVTDNSMMAKAESIYSSQRSRYSLFCGNLSKLVFTLRKEVEESVEREKDKVLSSRKNLFQVTHDSLVKFCSQEKFCGDIVCFEEDMYHLFGDFEYTEGATNLSKEHQVWAACLLYNISCAKWFGFNVFRDFYSLFLKTLTEQCTNHITLIALALEMDRRYLIRILGYEILLDNDSEDFGEPSKGSSVKSYNSENSGVSSASFHSRGGRRKRENVQERTRGQKISFPSRVPPISYFPNEDRMSSCLESLTSSIIFMEKSLPKKTAIRGFPGNFGDNYQNLFRYIPSFPDSDMSLNNLGMESSKANWDKVKKTYFSEKVSFELKDVIGVVL